MESRVAGAAGRIRISLLVRGVVQGVGFRPFVARLARELGLGGFVLNATGGVKIEVEGPEAAVFSFEERLVSQAPPLSRIEGIRHRSLDPLGETRFDIVASELAPEADSTLLPPDVAPCPECVADIFDPAGRRFGHAFASCTSCGPRFSIVERLPYDRPATTMAGFPMCEECRREYTDPADRRYHAQPICCPSCGPCLELFACRLDGSAEGARLERLGGGPEVVWEVRRALRQGRIVGVKAIGGYQLACDATSEEAVSELRRRKARDHKPFAVMVADLDQARAMAELSPEEEALLCSPARPIVLVSARPGCGLAESVAPGNPLVGLMLCSSPLHHLIFRGWGAETGLLGPLVMTSANLSSEPICYDEAEDAARLARLADLVVGHDRQIVVPADDSVARVVGGKPMMIRRARGYVPLPVELACPGPAVLAVGGELKNAFCLTQRDRAWVSQHIGDLESLRAMEIFERLLVHFKRLFGLEPELVAYDAHPGYISSNWARMLELSSVAVYHHHAHIAAVLAEHRVDPHAKVIGFAFDGTGYGPDGTIWGGEVLVADAMGFERAYHLSPFLLPGGDAAARAPARLALAELWSAGIDWERASAPREALGAGLVRLLRSQLESNLACVQTTSMGRLFDAVSSLVGCCQVATYEGQAAAQLEYLAMQARSERSYRFEVGGGLIDQRPVLEAIVEDVGRGLDPREVAAAFHRGLASAVVGVASELRDRLGLGTVVLSGGVFQNALLTQWATRGLSEAGFRVLRAGLLPPNDGGLSLGQAWVAISRTQVEAVPSRGLGNNQGGPQCV